MNAHKKLLMVSRGRLRMTHSLCVTIIALVFTAGMLGLLAAPVECAEIYTSAGSHYPIHFPNSYQKHTYEVDRLDAVYFAGKEVVFFTIDSDTDDNNFLYYHDLHQRWRYEKQ